MTLFPVAVFLHSFLPVSISAVSGSGGVDTCHTMPFNSWKQILWMWNYNDDSTCYISGLNWTDCFRLYRCFLYVLSISVQKGPLLERMFSLRRLPWLSAALQRCIAVLKNPTPFGVLQPTSMSFHKHLWPLQRARGETLLTRGWGEGQASDSSSIMDFFLTVAARAFYNCVRTAGEVF